MNSLELLNIKRLKSLGQIQSPFMFKVNMASIPTGKTGENSSNFSYLIRSTMVPYSFERENRLIRLAGDKEFIIPSQYVYTGHEWNITFLFLENKDKNFKILDEWFFLIDRIPISIAKAYATIELLALDQKTNYTFYLDGILLKKLDVDTELNYEESSGFFTYSTTLTFDDIYFEKEGKTFRNIF
jgi:hypothetical protein